MRRVYVPAGTGLGPAGLRALGRLPARLQSVVVQELDDPDSAREIARLLRSPEPEKALAARISSEVAEALRTARLPGAGMGDLGKFSFKKLAKRVKKIHKKIQEKIVPKAILKYKRKVEQAGKRIWKKYGSVIIAVVGIVLSIALPGVGTAIAAVLAAANTMYMKKRQAEQIKKTNKREAERLGAEVAAQEQTINADLDKLYGENAATFEAAGITRDKWAALTVEQKLAVIEKINKGEIPVTSPAVIAQAVADGTVPQPTAPPPDWTQVIQSADIYQTALAAARERPIEPAPVSAPADRAPVPRPGVPAPGAPERPPLEEEKPSIGPEGKYELYVEGEKVFESTNSADTSDAVGREAKPGDRFEVRLNGRSLGLKLRVKGGVVSVPADQETKVREMSREEVQSMISRSAAVASGEKPEEGGGIPWWLVVGGAAAAIAATR
ncbi:MAG: hypothetical protein ACRD1Z_08000 [Vicinamibacteria bacterium]